MAVVMGTGNSLFVHWLLNVPATYKSRVSNQNGVSLLYIMLELHHSGREPSKCILDTNLLRQ